MVKPCPASWTYSTTLFFAGLGMMENVLSTLLRQRGLSVSPSGTIDEYITGFFGGVAIFGGMLGAEGASTSVARDHDVPLRLTSDLCQ